MQTKKIVKKTGKFMFGLIFCVTFALKFIYHI